MSEKRMDIEKAIDIMNYNKYMLGMPEQGNTWKPNACTIACDIAIEALEKQKTDAWISVTERLPEEKGEYIVQDENNQIIITYFDPIADNTFWENGKWTTDFEVIAWKSLPEPYKGETNGKE